MRKGSTGRYGKIAVDHTLPTYYVGYYVLTVCMIASQLMPNEV